MNALQIVAILLIVLGILGLAYGSFTYVKSTNTTKIGPLELSVQDKETVNIPIWAGIGAVVAGAVMLIYTKRK